MRWMVCLVLAVAALATATGWCAMQPPAGGTAPYSPAVPAGSSASFYGGWPGYSTGASTAAGSAMNGMASVISAAGDYNLSTSAAAVNMTQAQKQEIENRQAATNAYFEMRATNRAAREAERGPRPTMEQMVRVAQMGVPQPLDPYQLDPVTGKLHWPGPLTTDAFESARVEIDGLLAKRAAHGGLGFSDQMKVQETVDGMVAELRSQIRSVPPQDYVASRNFLQRLLFGTLRTES